MKRESAVAFGRTLRARRQAAGVTQEELAYSAGVHRTFVSLLERGERSPSFEAMRKLASALGTTAGDLVLDAERALKDQTDATS
jgi:transcriptional regulator with XRE-family HTH domain